MATAAAPAIQAPVAGAGWSRGHTVAVVAVLAGIAGAGALVPWAAGPDGDYRAARLAAWLATLALFGALAAVIGHGTTGLARGVFVDDRRKLSLSRVQMFLWTALVLSAYLTAALANVGLGAVEPLGISVPQTLLQAMGLSTFSLVAAPAVLHGVKRKVVTVNAHREESSWLDLISGEEAGTAGGVDLGKLQLLLVTIVLVLGYSVVLGHAFASDRTVIGTLPKIDDAFVAMLAISHAGYLAKKTVPTAHRT